MQIIILIIYIFENSDPFQKDFNNNNNKQDFSNKNNIKISNHTQNMKDNEIKKLLNKIENLKNEVIDKNKIIKKLEISLKEKENLPSLKQYDEIKNNYENLKLDIDNKNKMIKSKEIESKELKRKIDDLVEQNKNLKEVIKRKEDENENIKMDLESLKEELSLNMKKITNLEILNKKINKDYESLNKDFFAIKIEKEKLEAELEESKANIFNYQKELSKNHKKQNNKYNFQNDYNNYNDLNLNIISDKKMQNNNEEFEINRNEYENETLSKNKNFKDENYIKEPIESDIQNYSKNYKTNMENNKNGALRKKNYTNFDLDKYNYTKTKTSLKDLDSDLSYFIAEKKKLENKILKMPEHPRNLIEIKTKDELNNKIENIEHKINSIRMKIRNFNY